MLSLPAAPATQATPILSVSGLSKRYGGLVALADYDLRPVGRHDPRGHRAQRRGQDHAVQPALAAWSRRRPARSSSTGRSITHLPGRSRWPGSASRGRSRTSACSTTCTVIDNVKVGVQAHHPASLLARRSSSRRSFRRREGGDRGARAGSSWTWSAWRTERDSRTASSLPYGDQRRLEIARALAVEPTHPAPRRAERGDEPGRDGRAAGAHPAASATSCGVTIILIAHDIPLVMNLVRPHPGPQLRVAHRRGRPATVRADPGGRRRLHRSGARMLELDRRPRLLRQHPGLARHLARGPDAARLVAVIGSNGAGKSTTLRTISGLMRARSGSIRYDGMDITQASTDRIVALGISHCPEGRRIFGRLTVRENLVLGGIQRPAAETSSRTSDAWASSSRASRSGMDQPGGTLSGGEQQMLAIARALMSQAAPAHPRRAVARPRAAAWSSTSSRSSRSSSRQGLTILLVEQNVHHALDVADRAYVMETGRIRSRAPPTALRHDPRVEGAYLGFRAEWPRMTTTSCSRSSTRSARAASTR